ncbi:DUF2290 domain-containing protein [Marinobacter daepoensis]|uniref:DUF2290 domain-containing protein n=1 Tax=Marinobacter daepoensis TaxID=262077 RepID=A0ABS3BBW6_9GAMM|nr:DUF2290 domain-containing protein [Marinobacter daepoensis]MBN7769033.1 DUF2290 domain-containing protein [Marinobacter daepoensis]MBY6077723.1 DUF2290 domain-containing protein [Marinobacter daepoensis]
MDISDAKKKMDGIAGKFASIIQSSNYYIGGDTISWSPYRPGIDKYLAYAREYERLLNDRQFSFLLIDDSFIQFYYKWDEKGLEKARLAYYPKPLKVVENKEELLDFLEENETDALMEFYFGAVDWMESGVDIVNTSHVRLDFDRDVEAHSSCHLQLGAINDLRIASSDLINPVIFWHWILRQVMREEYSPMLASNIVEKFLKYEFSRSVLKFSHGDEISLIQSCT